MSKTENIGRVIGKDSSKGYIVIRLDHRVMAEFGELWIIDDEDQPARYFARVVDTGYGVDISKDDGISDYAKTLLDNPDMSLNEVDRELIGFNFAFVDLLGVISDGEIVDYYRIPSILSEVRKPHDAEFALIVK
jgi:hypothetical protein